MPETYFITGGVGFIGNHVAIKLLNAGHKVVLYDAFKMFIPPWDNPRFHQSLNVRLDRIRQAAANNPAGQSALTIIEGDIRNVSLLRRSLDCHRPQVVIHLAAIPIADASKKFIEDMMEINLEGTTTLLNTIKDLSGAVRRFVFTSSSMAYGNFIREPADEIHPTVPLETYGATKLCGEVMVRTFGSMFGLEYAIVRPCSVYGPTDCNKRIVQRFVEYGLEGKEVSLYNNGQARLDFTYVEDAADGFVLAANHPKAAGETFNITRGEGRTLLDLATIVKKYLPDLRVRMAGPDPVVRPKRGAMDISKAKTLLGYNPRFSLEDGVRGYIDYYRELNRFGHA